jgi:hypothetical protein
MALGIGQQLRSSWFSAADRPYSDDLLIQQFAPQNISSAGAAVMNDWWFGPTSAVVGLTRVPGPGISPFQQLQFRGLSPLSNFIQNTVLPLTGISIATASGLVGTAFGGQAFAATAGTLIPSLSLALSANNWISSGPPPAGGLGKLLHSSWMLDAGRIFPDDLLITQFAPQNLNSAGPAALNDWWFGPPTGIQGPWVNASGQQDGWVSPGWQLVTLTASQGQVLPFGNPFVQSPPAVIRNVGPGVGPFANTQFSAQLPGISFNVIAPLTGSTINSATGTVGVVFDTILLTGSLISSATGTLNAFLGSAVALGGQAFASAQGNISQTIFQMPLVASPITVSMGGITFLFPPGPGGDLASTIKAIIEAGLDPQVFYTRHPAVPAGIVISLTPPVGTPVPPNTAVVVLVSTGPGGSLGSSVVPVLVGLYWKDATDALEGAFLSNDKYIWKIDPVIPQGVVTAQSIQSGTSVPPGTIVQLTLSAGPVKVIPPVQVP